MNRRQPGVGINNDHFAGAQMFGGQDSVFKTNQNPNPQSQFQTPQGPKDAYAAFSIGSFMFACLYGGLLVLLTFLLVLTQRRVRTVVSVPSILVFLLYYIGSTMILKMIVGHNFAYQAVASLAIGLTYFKFRKLQVIGLTGGIACGKSTLVKELSTKLKARVLDCDKINHRLQEPGQPCYEAIINEFGEEILDDNRKINRDKLRTLVFNDRSLKRRLERITHYNIMKELLLGIWDTFFWGTDNFVIIDAPLLYESKVLEWICYPVVVVHVSDKKLWLTRLMERDQCTEEEALLKIKNQMPIEYKVAKAEIAVDNKGDKETLVKEFGQKFLQFISN
jgi:dephospho-CoA kinase